MSSARRSSWAVWALIGVAGLVVGLALHLWTPSGGIESSICLFRRTLHLPCPGCGMTRALAAMAKGEWANAWRFHPFAYVAVLESALFWLAAGAGLARSGRFPEAGRGLTAVLLVQVGMYLALWTGRVATGSLPW